MTWFLADRSGQPAIKRRAELDFSPATLIQVLRHRIRGGRGVKAFDDLDDTGGVGGPEFGKTWWRNTWTLPNYELSESITLFLFYALSEGNNNHQEENPYESTQHISAYLSKVFLVRKPLRQ